MTMAGSTQQYLASHSVDRLINMDTILTSDTQPKPEDIQVPMFDCEDNSFSFLRNWGKTDIENTV